MRKPSDHDLLELIGSDDVASLGALYDRHAPLLALRLRRSGASVEEAEDVIQETFLDVWRSAPSYRGEAPVAAWLWGIAWRKFSMLVRGEVRLRNRQAKATEMTFPSSSDDSNWAAMVDATHALGELSEELSAAFRAVAIEGLSIAEVASRLGIPEGTVKSRVHRARKILAQEAP